MTIKTIFRHIMGKQASRPPNEQSQIGESALAVTTERLAETGRGRDGHMMGHARADTNQGSQTEPAGAAPLRDDHDSQLLVSVHALKSKNAELPHPSVARRSSCEACECAVSFGSPAIQSSEDPWLCAPTLPWVSLSRGLGRERLSTRRAVTLALSVPDARGADKRQKSTRSYVPQALC